jgi:predicted ester cyclase
MSIERNKVTARRCREELWHGRLEVADEILDPNCSFEAFDLVTPEIGRGPRAVRELVEVYRAGFPDVRFTIEEVIAEDDRVAVRWSAQGTHAGGLLGIPPTGRACTASGTDLYRIRGDKIIESRVHWDAMGLLQQIGALPAGAAAAS